MYSNHFLKNGVGIEIDTDADTCIIRNQDITK